MRKRRIVTIGGGTGLYTLLTGLREYDLDITSVVAMTDDGGSTGELRVGYGVLPPGDIRRSLVALSDSPERMRELFQYRFSRGGLAGHAFGNLFITALREITGSDEQAIAEAGALLRIRGRVLPVTLDNRQLCAELADGQIVKGQAAIDRPKDRRRPPITRVFLDESARANPKVLAAIRRADMIVLGPGDLYGSIVANLVVGGVAQAIRSSRARVVYVCNLMTKPGQTDGFEVADFVRVIEQYLGRGSLNYIVFSQLHLGAATRRAYAKEQSAPVRFQRANGERFRAKFVRAQLASKGNLLRHDPAKLARTIWAILQLDNSLTFVN